MNLGNRRSPTALLPLGILCLVVVTAYVLRGWDAHFHYLYEGYLIHLPPQLLSEILSFSLE
jgi:hypothetical protein